MTIEPIYLTASERKDIVTILTRRSNEIAHYSDENRGKIPASVEMALDLEIARLRKLATKVEVPVQEED